MLLPTVRPGLILLLLFALIGTPSQAFTPPPPVPVYLAALAEVETSAEPVSMEALLAAAEAVQDALMYIEPDGERAWMETLELADFATLREQLRGIRLARGFDVYAQPDPNFLSELAQRQGLPADRAFFRVYRRSWKPDGVPDYLRLVPGKVTPCVRFGEGVVGDLYAEWRDFQAQFPQAYRDTVTQWVRDLEEVVELGTCACGGQQAVEEELSSFVNRFPGSPARAGILARLQELEDDPERRPVNCR